MTGIEERDRLERLERHVADLKTGQIHLKAEQRRMAEEQQFGQLQFSEFAHQERDYHKTTADSHQSILGYLEVLLSKLDDFLSRLKKLERGQVSQ